MENKYLENELEIFLKKSKTIKPFLKEKLNSLFENISINELASGFLELISQLNEDLEENTPYLLNEIYENLYKHITYNTFKTIININANTYISTPIFLEKNKYFTSHNCVFSILEDVTIWPLYIKNFEFIKNNLPNLFETNTSYLLKIQLNSLNIPIKKMNFTSLKFYIHNLDGQIFLKDLFFNQSVVEGYIVNSDNETLKNFKDNFIQKVNVKWYFKNLSQAINIIEDFYRIPEIYQYIIIENIDLSNIFEDLIIYIPINMSKKYHIDLYLWTLIGENLFITKTDPFKINLTHTQQLLKINNFNNNVYIFDMLKCFILNKNNINEIMKDNNKNWNITNKNNLTYISFNNLEQFNNQWAYGEVIAHNGENVNNLNLNSLIQIEEYTNITGNFLVLPTYENIQINKNIIMKYLNTDYKHLLSNSEEFIKIINNLLHYFNKETFILIESIRITPIIKHKKWGNTFVPIKGQEIFLKFKTNLVDPFFFLKILHIFITNYSSINIFINFKTIWNGHTYNVEESIE